MISKISDLKNAINQKQKEIVIDRHLLGNTGTSAEQPWVEIGFGGFAEMIQSSMMFLMSPFSSKWNQAYTKKKLQYRYQLIKKDDQTMTFDLKK